MKLFNKKLRTATTMAVTGLITMIATPDARASGEFASLKTVPIPVPANIGDFVKDNQAAIALGKALFWDMQTGGLGMQACATCHFNAGADSRLINQLNPGHNGVFDVGGPNYQLTAADFPFHKLADVNNRDSAVISDKDDVAGSQGVFNMSFMDIRPGSPVDIVQSVADPVFNVLGINTRRTTGRNTPSNINAVFNFRNFWDGRAQNDFNGVSPFGSRDVNAKVAVADSLGNLSAVKISIPNSSAASQAVGPPNNPTEMSADGRTFPKLGKKLLSLTPLGKQLVAPDDSVLGSMSRSPKPGLNTMYATLIKAAFQDKWWKSKLAIMGTDAQGNLITAPMPSGGLTTGQFSQMEWNFSLFWGLAIQAYESTLISDNSPFDQFMEGNVNALTDLQKKGMDIFSGQGHCTNCHTGAALSDATVAAVTAGFENSVGANTGFHDNGVRPVADDLGNGGSDPFGKSLSITRVDSPAVHGTFKTPVLRNLELTAPFFHNGSQATLRQVVEFYNRGGDFANFNQDPNVKSLGLSEDDKDALVAFLMALTDERVRNQSAPFDHPQLFVPNGSPGNQFSVTAATSAPIAPGAPQAAQIMMEIKATGRNGSAPLVKFLQ